MSDRWRKVTELFHGALEMPPDQRGGYLEAACKDDAALRQEVASLLAYHDRAATFLERPADLGASSVDAPDGGSLVGRRLGQYTVLRRLGHGGMGIVYLAEDTRLGRMVALKALAPKHTLDERRRERLRREARAAAALTHPGIATIYALEEFDEHLYIASEYVPGETLRQEIARGALPLDLLIETGAQIARALASAHERGIIHRDLKPENVMRAPDGQIKILDFGLARFYGPATGGGPPDALTDDGTILGTPAYMAPEQLRGWTADARADVFAFGVMMFELASGNHPFAGSTPASMIARTLEAEPPDLTKVAPSLPPAIAKLLHRCLAKDRDARPASMREVVRALEDAHRRTGEAAARATARRTRTPAGRGRRFTPRWWWQFHQVWVGAFYFLTLIPLWIIRSWTPRPWGVVVFVTMVAVAVLGGNLRWHLWFTSLYNADQLATQRARYRRAIAVCDVLVAGLMLGAAVAIVAEHVFWGSYLIAIGLAILFAAIVIEPATTSAAFVKPRSGRRKTPQ